MKEQKFLQVVDNEAADALVSREHSLFGRLKRAIIGIPIYKGHGDLKDIDPKALANTEHKIKLGVVDQVRKASRGLEAHFALDNDGAQAVAAGYKFPSSFWWVKASGQRGDAILARPVKLISVALTQFPNISGVESLANSRDAARTQNPKPKTRMKELLTGWLAAKGIVLANDASDTVVLEAVQRQAAESANSLVALGNEKTTLGGKVTALENELAPLRQRVATAETALTTEQTGRKAERKGRAEAVTDLAIARGKIAVAERDGQVAALSNAKDEAEFTTLAGNLVKGATRYKTTSTEAESGKVLANEQEEAAEVYQREFSKALIQTGQDPIKAHRKVMTMPGLAEKLSVKRR
jgi:phage I-like protein